MSAWRLHPRMREYVLRLSNVRMSLRQASKWGMRRLQGPFPHCKKCRPTESMKRRIILESIVLFHNYRTELVGCNQIKTVFDPECKRSINIEGYYLINRFYLRPDDFDSNDDESDYEL
jgi:hypothetical protein